MTETNVWTMPQDAYEKWDDDSRRIGNEDSGESDELRNEQTRRLMSSGILLYRWYSKHRRVFIAPFFDWATARSGAGKRQTMNSEDRGVSTVRGMRIDESVTKLLPCNSRRSFLSAVDYGVCQLTDMWEILSVNIWTVATQPVFSSNSLEDRVKSPWDKASEMVTCWRRWNAARSVTHGSSGRLSASVCIRAGAVVGECHPRALSLLYGDESCCSNGLSVALKLRDRETMNKHWWLALALSQLSRLAAQI